jgi:major type 1 subunit fimbrin (pilin)
MRRARTLLVVVAAAVAMSRAAVASDGTITFTGAITENSCTVSVDGAGSSDGTVALPVVDATALARGPAPQGTAAGTFFHIALSGCVLTHADVAGNVPGRVAVYFEAGPTVDAATHALINSGTSNVEVQLYEATGATQVGSQIMPGTVAGQSAAGAGTWYFYAGYSLAAPGPVRAGTVSTSVTYSLVYQ